MTMEWGEAEGRVAYKTIYGNEVQADAAIGKIADEMGRCLSVGDAMTPDTC